MQRILVIRGGAIGDFVLTLPMLAALRGGFPKAQIEVLGYKHIVALAGEELIHAVRSIEYGALAGFFARGAELPAELSDYFRSFDLIISYLFDPDGIFAQNLRRAGADEILLAPANVVEPGAHAAQQLARPLAELGLELETTAASLHPPRAEQAAAEEILRGLPPPIVALHPGSGGERKNWPLERWLRLAEELRDCSLLIVGGEADRAQLARCRTLPNERLRFAESLPLPRLAALLARCRLFVGHDSGVSHIAAAVQTPCVLLFGPTDPAIWAPANPQVTVLRAAEGALAEIPVERAVAAVRAVLREEAATS